MVKLKLDSKIKLLSMALVNCVNHNIIDRESLNFTRKWVDEVHKFTEFFNEVLKQKYRRQKISEKSKDY